MKIPALWSCTCGHLGQHHQPDGQCRTCKCDRFTHATHTQQPALHHQGHVRKARTGGRTHPTRDSW